MLMENDCLYDIIMNAFVAGMETGKAECNKEKDIISMRKASSIFGQAWVTRVIDEGKVQVHRSSFAKNAKFYLSYSELVRVLKAQQICKLYFKDKYKR